MIRKILIFTVLTVSVAAATQVGGNPTPTPTPPPGSVPSAPSNLQAGPFTDTLIVLSWTDNSNNENGFWIESCLGYDCTNFGPIAQVGPNWTFFSFRNLSPDTWYRYRVRAFNGAGDSAYSNEVTVLTLPSDF
jgi:hypothetical protein